jgi:hypothetical protein
MKVLATLPYLTSLSFSFCETLPLGPLISEFISAQTAAQQQQQQTTPKQQQQPQLQQQPNSSTSNTSSSSSSSKYGLMQHQEQTEQGGSSAEGVETPKTVSSAAGGDGINPRSDALGCEKRSSVLGLRQLVLSGNAQLRVCGSVLGQLTGLQQLNLAGCRAVGGRGLEGLTGLKELNLAGERYIADYCYIGSIMV